jgi:hypothetical protein
MQANPGNYQGEPMHRLLAVTLLACASMVLMSPIARADPAARSPKVCRNRNMLQCNMITTKWSFR